MHNVMAADDLHMKACRCLVINICKHFMDRTCYKVQVYFIRIGGYISRNLPLGTSNVLTIGVLTSDGPLKFVSRSRHIYLH